MAQSTSEWWGEGGGGEVNWNKGLLPGDFWAVKIPPPPSPPRERKSIKKGI